MIFSSVQLKGILVITLVTSNYSPELCGPSRTFYQLFVYAFIGLSHLIMHSLSFFMLQILIPKVFLEWTYSSMQIPF